MNIAVNTGSGMYDIVLEASFAGLPALLKALGFEGRKMVIVTDDQVGPLYLDQLRQVLGGLQVEAFVFPAGEAQKTLSTIYKIYEFFLAQKLDRKSVVIGLGGGVCGDMAGFAAATYLRGIPYIQAPTTLLAQVDSSVGGKTGVDFLGNKNMVGAFYQPALVYISIDTLATLPERQFAAGMAEVIKYGLILDGDFYQSLFETVDKNAGELQHIIAACCCLKADVVAKDEKESSLRAILNFGHTIGHAIETLMEFQLLHGECVGLGMICAMEISKIKGHIASEEVDHLVCLLAKYNLPTVVKGLKAPAIYEQLYMDKKVSAGKINFILLSAVGECYNTNDVTKEEIYRSLERILV